MICSPQRIVFLAALLQACFCQDDADDAAYNATGLGEWVAPDFTECNAIYGVDLQASACNLALQKIWPDTIPRPLRFVRQKKGGSLVTTVQVPFEVKDEGGRKPLC